MLSKKVDQIGSYGEYLTLIMESTLLLVFLALQILADRIGCYVCIYRLKKRQK